MSNGYKYNHLKITNNMWNNLQNLVSLSNVIQWISIGMIFIGGLLQLGKYFVDNKIGTIKDKDIAKNEILRQETEGKLNNQVDSLKFDLTDSKHEITELRKKTKYVDPFTQPIQSCVATVYVKIKSGEKVNANYMDLGGYVAFGIKDKEILYLSDSKCDAKSINQEVILYNGVFNLDANHPSIGRELSFLKGTEYIQLQFMPMKQDYDVLDGKVVCTFNGNARMEFLIPEQKMHNKLIFIRNLTPKLNEIFK